MIDFDAISRKVAEDLCRRNAPSTKDLETVVHEAFRRGLQLGLSVRTPGSLTRSPDGRTPPSPPPRIH